MFKERETRNYFRERIILNNEMIAPMIPIKTRNQPNLSIHDGMKTSAGFKITFIFSLNLDFYTQADQANF